MEVNTFLGLQFRTSLKKHFVVAGIAGNLDRVIHFDDLRFSMFLGHGVLTCTPPLSKSEPFLFRTLSPHGDLLLKVCPQRFQCGPCLIG